MSVRVGIDYVKELMGIHHNLMDEDFSQTEYLNEREPIKDLKGQRVSKSYYFNNEKEIIRIEYFKLYGDYSYDNVTYPNVYLGIRKVKIWLLWDGEIHRVKEEKPYYFTLEPTFIGDGTETVTGFSSPKMRAIMREERYNADDYLQAKNPDLYALLFGRYTAEYEYYLKTGKKANLVDAITNEADVNINAVFDNLVFGTTITVRDLILMNLQG